MITTLRVWIQSRSAKMILWVTIFALAGVFSIPEFIKMFTGDSSWALKINKDKISQGAVSMRINARQHQAQLMRSQYGDNAEIILQAYGFVGDQTDRVTEMIVGEALLAQAARKAGIKLSDDYMQEHGNLVISELMGVLGDAIDPHYGLDPRKIYSLSHRYGLPGNFVEEAARAILERHLMLDLISNAAYIPSFEIEQHMRNTFAPRTFSLLDFSYAHALEVEKKGVVSEQEIASFYKMAHEAKGHYWVPEKRSATVWHFTPADYGIVVNEQDIENYYDDHKTSRYTLTPVKVTVRKILVKVEEDALAQVAYEKAQQLLDRIVKEKQEFAKVAQEASDDTASAKNGGLLAPFARGTYDIDFEKAAFVGLKKDGDISPITRTKEGFVIIQRIAKIPATFKPLASVKEEIRAALLQRAFSERFIGEVSPLADAYKQKPQELEAFIAQKKGRKETLTNVERSNEKLGKVLFGLKEGEATATFDDREGVIVILNGVAKRYLPSLESIKAVVKEDLYAERAARRIVKDLEKAKAMLKDHPSSEVAATFGARLETIKDLTPAKEEVLKNLEKRGVPVDEMLQMEKIGGVVASAGEKDGFLIKLESIGSVETAGVDAAKKNELLSSLRSQEEALLAQGLVASLYRTATISSNQLRQEVASDDAELPSNDDFSY